MRTIINLEDFSNDGFKTGANNPFGSTPDNITHCRLYNSDPAADTLYYQGVFVTSKPNTVAFNIDAPVGSLFKLFESTNGTTYTENKAYGGDDGVTLPLDSGYLDADDFSDNQIPYKNPITGLIEPTSIGDLLTAENINSSGEALPYYAFNGNIQQRNSSQSGKAYLNGTPTLNTIADSISTFFSSKISTGRYVLQFMVGSSNGSSKGLKVYNLGESNEDDLNSSIYSYLWKPYSEDIYEYDADTNTTTKIGTIIVGANLNTSMFVNDVAALAELGAILIETKDASGNYADDILTNGFFISIKRYKQG